jgi:hypothetical protein
MIDAAFPGAMVRNQGQEVQVQLASGEWRTVSGVMSGFLGSEGYTEWRYGALNTPAEAIRIGDKVRSFESVAAGTAPAWFFVFHLNSSAQVVEQKMLVIDDAAMAAQIGDASLESDGGSGWPLLGVVYSGMYAGNDWAARIGWSAKVDTSTMRVVERLPVEFEKKLRNGTNSGEVVRTYRIDASTVEMVGEKTGRKVRSSCGTECIVPADVLAAQW